MPKEKLYRNLLAITFCPTRKWNMGSPLRYWPREGNGQCQMGKRIYEYVRDLTLIDGTVPIVKKDDGKYNATAKE